MRERKGGCCFFTLSIPSLYLLTSAICPRSQSLLREAVMLPPVTSSVTGPGGFDTICVKTKFQLHLGKSFEMNVDLLVKKDEEMVTDLWNHHLKRQCRDSDIRLTPTLLPQKILK